MNDDLSFLKPIADQQPYPLLFATVSGAHLYGFPSPDSDYDLRGAHILPIAEVSGLYEAQETLEVEGEVNEWRLSLHREFDRAYQTTKLPTRPDYERANAFLIAARRSVL